MPLSAFVIATLAMNFAPGPDMTYVAARSLGQGRRAGVISAERAARRCWRSSTRARRRSSGRA